MDNSEIFHAFRTFFFFNFNLPEILIDMNICKICFYAIATEGYNLHTVECETCKTKKKGIKVTSGGCALEYDDDDNYKW